MSGELAVVAEILRLAQDDSVSVARFVEPIGRSPRLAAAVVRAANSPLYGVRGTIARLDRAALILGTRTIANIASSLLVAERARRLAIPGLARDAFWLHSLAIAVEAELLARWLDVPNAQEAYLAGLLHAIGVLELLERHRTAYAELVARAHRERADLEPYERDALGTTHREALAAWIASAGLPAYLALPDLEGPPGAGSSGRTGAGDRGPAPELPPEERARAALLGRLVAAAHALDPAREDGWSERAPGHGAEALAALELGEEDAEELRAAAKERLEEIAALAGALGR